MSEKKKTMRAVIEIIIAVLVIIAVYFIIRGMDRHDVRIQQAATENETQRVWKEFQEKTVSIKLHKKTWKFAHPVQTYLFIGTDKSGNEDAEGEEYHGSMADALMGVPFDLTKHRGTQRVPLCLVPVVGLEPTRYCYQRILSPSRLPIPSHRRICSNFVHISV